MSGLTHFDAAGHAHMVDVGGKQETQRIAVARGTIRMLPATFELIRDGRAKIFRFEHFLYSGRELKDRLLACGFAEVELYGDLQGAPYGLDAARLVAVARKS